MGIPISILKQNMTHKEFRERGAYYAVQELNHSQTDINIARIALSYHNVNYKEKLTLKDVLTFNENEEHKSKEVSLNVAQWHCLATKGVNK